MEKLKDLNELKHKLVEAVKMELAGGVEGVDTQEMGEVIDMIKDLASAEKDCMEACYYELVCEAMDGGESERMGYDRWRYASGRFAPKGRGSVRGYLPPYMNDSALRAEPMGYDGRTTRMDGDRMRTGSATSDYRGRSGYTHEDMTMEDGMTSREKIDKAIGIMGDIWSDASMEDRKTMKTLLRDLLSQMEQN